MSGGRVHVALTCSGRVPGMSRGPDCHPRPERFLTISFFSKFSVSVPKSVPIEINWPEFTIYYYFARAAVAVFQPYDIIRFVE